MTGCPSVDEGETDSDGGPGVPAEICTTCDHEGMADLAEFLEAKARVAQLCESVRERHCVRECGGGLLGIDCDEDAEAAARCQNWPAPPGTICDGRPIHFIDEAEVVLQCMSDNLDSLCDQDGGTAPAPFCEVELSPGQDWRASYGWWGPRCYQP